MTKSDLKDGMIIKARYGYTYLVCKNIGRIMGIFGHDGFLELGNYGEDLSYPRNADFDVMAVYTLTCINTNVIKREQLENCKCIWRREKTKTIAELAAGLEENIKNLTATLELLKAQK